MRFMLLLKSDQKAEAGVLPDEKLLAEMGAFNEQMVKAGVMLGGEGLQSSAKGVRVRRSRQGATTIVDGPFADARELIAGFWIIQTATRREAVEWARRVPVGDAELEIRQVFEMSDFPVDAAEGPEGWREQEERFRDAAGTSAGGSRDAPAPAQPVRKPGTKRFIVMLKADAMTESAALPSQEVLTRMGALMDELAQSGALLAGEGLQPTSKGARVKLAGGKSTVMDGPFAETKELIAGYSIIQVRTKEEAVAFAQRWLEIHTDGVNVPEGEIEVRQLFEMEDFASDSPGGWQEQEKGLRDRLGQ